MVTRINRGSRRIHFFFKSSFFGIHSLNFEGVVIFGIHKISVGWIRKLFLDVIYKLFKYDMWICYIPLGPSRGISPAVFRMTWFRDELFELFRAVWSPLPACSERLGEIWEASSDPSSGWWSMMVRVVHFLFRFMGSSRLYSAMALPGRCLTPVAESERYSGTGGFLGGLVASSHSGCPSLGGTKLDVNIGWFGEIWCWVVLVIYGPQLLNMEPPSKIRILEIAGDSDSFWISTNRLQVFSIPQSLGIRGKMPLAATTSIKWSDDKCTIPKQTVLLKKRQWTQIFLFHWQP